MGDRVVVIGAGITGLCVASALADDGHDVTLLESGARAGGLVATRHEDGRVLDTGPAGWLDGDPAVRRLIERLDLAERVVPASPSYSTRWIFSGGKIHRAPRSPVSLLTSSLLTIPGRLRLLLEPLTRRGPGDLDETVGAFARRRLGREAADKLVGPMVAGIHGSDPDLLSVRAAFPVLAELEDKHRSLFLGMIALMRSGYRPGRLQTLDGGAGALVGVLAERLGERVLLETPARAVEQRHGCWAVHTDDDAVMADVVVLACPAPAQARIIRGIDGRLADSLAEIRYAPLTVVLSAWPAGAWDRAPEGFGVLLTRADSERLGGVLGTLFTSSVFPMQAHESEVLTRTFVGGAAADPRTRADDQALRQRVRTAHRAYFGEERAAPTMMQVVRHAAAIPQYTVGHLERVQAVRATRQRLRGLLFAGQHLDGVGLKACIRQAEQITDAARAALGATA